MSAPVNGAGLHILVVEDNADGALSLAMLLRMYGHVVETVANGPAALESVRTHEPDVVLLDIGLPGMSGYEVARRLIGPRPRKTPLVIAVTGFGQAEDRRRCAESGIDMHLLKPVEPEYLQAVLARFQKMLGARG